MDRGDKNSCWSEGGRERRGCSNDCKEEDMVHERMEGCLGLVGG